MRRNKPGGSEQPSSATVSALSSPTEVGAGAARLMLEACELYIGARCVSLSTMECRLMRILIERHRQVVTRSELMMAAWGVASAAHTAALEEHVSALRSRLGDQMQIVTIPGIGYSLL